MTRKDFELIASTLRDEIETAEAMFETHGARALRYTAEKMADRLAFTNPRFDRARFLRACGITV